MPGRPSTYDGPPSDFENDRIRAKRLVSEALRARLQDELPASEFPRDRCRALVASGTRCVYSARPFSAFCGNHDHAQPWGVVE